MKDLIAQLIGAGQTEDALNELAKHTSDGFLLLARFNAGKKQYNMGIIDFNDWQRVQAAVNAGAFDLAEMLDRQQRPPVPAPTDIIAPVTNNVKVFISYNHIDKDSARAVRQYLEQNSISVTIDEADLDPGESIDLFITESLKKVDYVVSIVSKNSLQSTWVSTESTMSMILQKTTEKQFIPVSLDNAVFDANFYFDAVDFLDQKIKTAQANVTKAIERNISARPFQDELNRYQDAKNHLGSIIEQLKSVLIIDISGEAFAAGMEKVTKRLLAN